MNLTKFDVARAQAGWGVRKGTGELVISLSYTGQHFYNGVLQPVEARTMQGLTYHDVDGYFWGTPCHSADLFIDEDMPPGAAHLGRLKGEEAPPPSKPGTGEDVFDPDALMKAIRDCAGGHGA